MKFASIQKKNNNNNKRKKNNNNYYHLFCSKEAEETLTKYPPKLSWIMKLKILQSFLAVEGIN